MDVDKIHLSPAERAEHIRKQLCSVCHREVLHLAWVGTNVDSKGLSWDSDEYEGRVLV